MLQFKNVHFTQREKNCHSWLKLYLNFIKLSIDPQITFCVTLQNTKEMDESCEVHIQVEVMAETEKSMK